MYNRFILMGLLGCGMAMGQSPVVPNAATTTQTTTSSAKPITFEVASIRRNTTGVYGGSGPTDDGYNVRNMYPVVLIGIVYGVLEFQRIQGLPSWCQYGGEGYDINAKVAESDIPEWRNPGTMDLQGALRALLEDRFQLKAHFETRNVPAFALMVAKNGPKFKAATPGDTYPNGIHDGKGKPMHGLRTKVDSDPEHGHIIAQSLPMSELAKYFTGWLGRAVGRPVVDKTGLTGVYDFSMPILSAWATERAPEESEASIFTVIQESLGLRLEPVKLPVEYLVIDHIERPTEN